MWWYGPGPWHGWWIMPIIGIVFMVIILFIIARFFSSGGGFCGRMPMDHAKDDDSIGELKKEVRALRDEVWALKNKD